MNLHATVDTSNSYLMFLYDCQHSNIPRAVLCVSNIQSWIVHWRIFFALATPSFWAHDYGFWRETTLFVCQARASCRNDVSISRMANFHCSLQKKRYNWSRTYVALQMWAKCRAELQEKFSNTYHVNQLNKSQLDFHYNSFVHVFYWSD